MLYVNELNDKTLEKVNFTLLFFFIIIEWYLKYSYFMKNNMGKLYFMCVQEYMSWSEAYQRTKSGELWGFIDLSANFTEETLDKYN